MKAQVYTQKEIFEIAKDSEALLKIIDREIEGIAELKNSSDKAFDDIINKKRQIREYEIICEKEQMLRTEISDLDGQITLFKQSGIADQIEAMQSFANEDAEIKRIQSVLNGYETSLKSSLDNLASLELRIDSEKCSSELQTVFSDVSQKVEIELENIDLAIAAIRAIRESIDGVLDEAGWSQKRDETKELFEKAKAELKEKNIEVTKLSDLLSSKAQKEKQLQNIEDAKKKQETAHSELKKLISEYNQRVKAIRTARESFVSSVLGQDDTVKIDFIPAANRESFEKMIKELTGKDGTKVNEDIQKLDEIVFGKRGLSEFRTIIRSLRKGQEVKEQFSSVFRKVVPEMDDDNFFRMEEFVPKDELVVSYKPEGSKRFVPLSIASAGQKTTAILTFILAYGDVPLILDQPEDDLDNKLVYELVVKRLKIAKRHRQIIVITHNANIPVNGDAEYITSMDSDSVFVKKKYEGTLDQDEIRSEICDVMEGSEYAFSMRAHKYHLRISK
jgi:DNA repair exonuclease SbcCD ATPase subunit